MEPMGKLYRNSPFVENLDVLAASPLAGHQTLGRAVALGWSGQNRVAGHHHRRRPLPKP